VTQRDKMEHMTFRVDPRLKELVHRVAKARGEDVSDFLRRAMLRELAELQYLSDAKKKALGIK